MENLITIHDKWAFIDVAPRPPDSNLLPRERPSESPDQEKIVAVTKDYETGSTYALTDELNLYTLGAEATEGLAEVSLIREDVLPDGGQVAHMEYLPDHEALFLASAGGELLLYHPQREPEVVGALEGGIAGLAWSPDGEALALVTGCARLLLMTREWEVLAEVDLEQDTGSSTAQQETSKAAAGPIAAGAAAEPEGAEPGSVGVSWRGDGKYFATISGGGLPGSAAGGGAGGKQPRQIRVWEREGCVLHACGEATPGLLRPIAWQPRGALIAAARDRRADNAPPEVLLYERNGLTRGSFALATPAGSRDAQVDALQWSMDSELLGVALQFDDVAAVQVWHRCNYHWYLKAELRSRRSDALSFSWDAERPLRLLAWTAAGALRQLDLVWETAVAPLGSSTAAVIDGACVRITPLRDAIIPPPMCALAARFPAPVQTLALGLAWAGGERAAGGAAETVLAVLADGTLGLVSCSPHATWLDVEPQEETADSPPQDAVRGLPVSLSNDEAQLGVAGLSNARHLAWLGPATCLAALPTCCLAGSGPRVDEPGGMTAATENGAARQSRGGGMTSADSLVELELSQHQEDFSSQWTAVVSKVSHVTQGVVRLLAHPRNNTLDAGGVCGGDSHSPRSTSALVQLDDGSVMKYVRGQGLQLLPFAAATGASTGGSLTAGGAAGAAQRTAARDPGSQATGLPQVCPWMQATWVASPDATGGALAVIVGLSDQGKLYAGGRLVASSVSSFALHHTAEELPPAPLRPDAASVAAPAPAAALAAAPVESSSGTSIGTGAGAVSLAYTTRESILHIVNLWSVCQGSTPAAAALSDPQVLAGSQGQAQGLPGSSPSLHAASPAQKRRAAGGGPKHDLGVVPVWERGARLVAALGGDRAALVLQTARGNLETMSPRPLILGAVGAALERGDYGAAMWLARRQRLDLNVLVDYGGWRRFADDAGQFVRQVASLAHVSELVCALQPGDVTQTIYQGQLAAPAGREDANSGASVGADEPGRLRQWMANGNAGGGGEGGGHPTGGSRPGSTVSEAKGGDKNGRASEEAPPGAAPAPQSAGGGSVTGGSKVREVCAAIRAALEAQVPRSAAREMCVLTTLVRSDPPDVEGALARVRDLRAAEVSAGGRHEAAAAAEEEEEGGEAAASENAPVRAEAALAHLMWLADPERVFAAALGLYDLPLAALVAAHSQKDPREFLPFLQELEALPPRVMRAAVDRRLGRWEGALRHLAAAGPAHFEECLELVRAHPELFPAAAEVFEGAAERRARVMEAWGQQLCAQERLEDAAAAFCSAGALPAALEAYRSGGHWRGVFTLAGRLGYSTEQMAQLAADVREELQSLGKTADAALVTLEYTPDVAAGVHMLAEARMWQEAARVAFARGHAHLVDATVAPAALDAARSQLTEVQEAIEKVGAYLARFKGLREKRLQLSARVEAAEREGWGGEGEGETDAMSEASTAVSGLSIYTHGTGHSRTPSLAPSGGTSASTRGGRRISRRAARRAAIGPGKIRAGSPGEEVALVEHLHSLKPPARQLEETGQLLELLIMLGHDLLARQLQQRLLKLMEVHKAAVEEADAAVAVDLEAEEQRLKMENEVAPGAGGQSYREGQGSAAAGSKKKQPQKAEEVRWKLIVLDKVGQ